VVSVSTVRIGKEVLVGRSHIRTYNELLLAVCASSMTGAFVCYYAQEKVGISKFFVQVRLGEVRLALMLSLDFQQGHRFCPFHRNGYSLIIISARRSRASLSALNTAQPTCIPI